MKMVHEETLNGAPRGGTEDEAKGDCDQQQKDRANRMVREARMFLQYFLISLFFHPTPRAA